VYEDRRFARAANRSLEAARIEFDFFIHGLCLHGGAVNPRQPQA
jgi:hypothetical protein